MLVMAIFAPSGRATRCMTQFNKSRAHAALPSRSSSLLGQQIRQHSGRRHRLGKAVLRASWGADVQFENATILEQGRIAEDLHRLIVDIGQPAAAGYTVPGQFIQAKVGDSKAGFFAIASPPDANNAGVVELLIKNQGGTAELLCAVPEGASVQVSAVMGKGFSVEKVPPTAFPKVLLFATGSGISPIKALIESGRLESGARQEVTLFYGARSPDFMAYRDRAAEWEAEHGVRVIPVYSKEGQGYVQDALKREGGVSSGEGVAAFLCGQKAMAEAITEALTSAGVSKDSILMNF